MLDNPFEEVVHFPCRTSHGGLVGSSTPPRPLFYESCNPGEITNPFASVSSLFWKWKSFRARIVGSNNQPLCLSSAVCLFGNVDPFHFLPRSRVVPSEAASLAPSWNFASLFLSLEARLLCACLALVALAGWCASTSARACRSFDRERSDRAGFSPKGCVSWSHRPPKCG